MVVTPLVYRFDVQFSVFSDVPSSAVDNDVVSQLSLGIERFTTSAFPVEALFSLLFFLVLVDSYVSEGLERRPAPALVDSRVSMSPEDLKGLELLATCA